MQKNYYKKKNTLYSIISKYIFFHNRILNKCIIVNIPRPQKTPLQQHMKVKYKEYNHLIELKYDKKDYGKNSIDALCEIIINKETSIKLIRNKLYNLLIYNISLWDFIHELISRLNKLKLLTNDNCLEMYALIYKTFA